MTNGADSSDNIKSRPPLDAPDIWRSWLAEGRQRGLDESGRERMQRTLSGIRDRVLRLAKIQPGERVLDVGAGTGLISLSARTSVRPTGRVTAMDISESALRTWREPAADITEGCPVDQVTADAQSLPLASGVFDVALARSVLMYLQDRRAAVQEIVRVLRPGGRVVLFEPVNQAGQDLDNSWGLAPSQLPSEHAEVVRHMLTAWPHRESVMSLNQDELVGYFRAAGCVRVRASTLMDYQSGQRVTTQEAEELLSREVYPGRMSYQQCAQAVLGDRAPAHLQSMLALVASSPLAFMSARVLVQATTAEGAANQ